MEIEDPVPARLTTRWPIGSRWAFRAELAYEVALCLGDHLQQPHFGGPPEMRWDGARHELQRAAARELVTKDRVRKVLDKYDVVSRQRFHTCLYDAYDSLGDDDWHALTFREVAKDPGSSLGDVTDKIVKEARKDAYQTPGEKTGLRGYVIRVLGALEEQELVCDKEGWRLTPFGEAIWYRYGNKAGEWVNPAEDLRGGPARFEELVRAGVPVDPTEPDEDLFGQAIPYAEFSESE
jgi:hypothetical protein